MLAPPIRCDRHVSIRTPQEKGVGAAGTVAETPQNDGASQEGATPKPYVMGDPPDYEPRAETSVAAIAAREGRSPDEVAYDYLTGDAGHFPFFPVTGYARDDHEPIREMLADPGTLLGLGDGGTHVAMICRSNTW